MQVIARHRETALGVRRACRELSDDHGAHAQWLLAQHMGAGGQGGGDVSLVVRVRSRDDHDIRPRLVQRCGQVGAPPRRTKGLRRGARVGRYVDRTRDHNTWQTAEDLKAPAADAPDANLQNTQRAHAATD